ncbi:unnamed protein product [Aureobasidium vineae]|uniref:Uncharacterized protein n=1 Tax=Aureobasidium vineae TaxID=2773715 RepID=A0A9N8JEB6_9PEZI|nr:unnamed protein product [Aureobasidium vineae]
MQMQVVPTDPSKSISWLIRKERPKIVKRHMTGKHINADEKTLNNGLNSH